MIAINYKDMVVVSNVEEYKASLKLFLIAFPLGNTNPSNSRTALIRALNEEDAMSKAIIKYPNENNIVVKEEKYF